MKLWRRIRSLWALEGFRPDIALSRDDSTRFLPWIIALMVYMAALMLAGGLTLSRTMLASQSAQVQSFSIHLPYSDQVTAKAQETLTLLKRTPGVLESRMLSNAEMQKLVEPWLGNADALTALPLPVIIEVRYSVERPVEMKKLAADLKAVAPDAELDDHKRWLADFSAFVGKIQWLLFGLAMAIVAATAAVVVFASKTSLRIHRGSVNLLHRLGAFDGYIAKQFQQHAALLTLKGAFVGCGYAAGTLVLLHIMARQINSPLFPSFNMSAHHWALLLAMPFGMSAIALLSTRRSVLAALKRMP